MSKRQQNNSAKPEEVKPEVAAPVEVAEPMAPVEESKAIPDKKEPVPAPKADRKPAVVAEAVEPEPEVEATYEEGKHTMLFNVEHDQTRYEKGKTYVLSADKVEIFTKNGWIK